MCLILSGLILVSTVCDAHQQMKLAGKELKDNWFVNDALP